MRVGFGFDVHGFAAGRPLVLGGVAIPSPKGLAGHSDADVLCHAVADALLGAANLGDIGSHWPATSESAGSSSVSFLTVVAGLLEKAGYGVVNVDSTIVAEGPRLASYRDQMVTEISTALAIDRSLVSVKATTTDGLGFAGRGEGIAAFAVATVSKVEE
jgi:2-C-methyl-D-erythritol 2,4-cyclodiphosphate synthase